VVAVNAVLKLVKKRCIIFFLCSSPWPACGFRNIAQSAGLSVNAFIADSTIEIAGQTKVYKTPAEPLIKLTVIYCRHYKCNTDNSSGDHSSQK
jgi:hypothetical protein